MSMPDLSHLSPLLHERAQKVSGYTIEHPGIEVLRAKALTALKNSNDLTQTLNAIHIIQRLYYAGELGVFHLPKIIDALMDGENFPSWENYAVLDATEEQRIKLAEQLYSGYAPVAPVILFLGDYARKIGEAVLTQCMEHKDQTDIWIDDRLFVRRITACLEHEDIIRFGELLAKRYESGKRRIVAFAESPSVPYIDAAQKELEDLRQKTFMKIMNEKNLWLGQLFTGTILPSHVDAKADEMAFDEYVRLYFAMCNIDLNKVDQAHKILIEELNKGEKVHITNSDGTDITFGIKGMTFLNSMIEANIPGTEVFSAPEVKKVNGIIVAKGLFYVPLTDEEPIRDITLEFRDGRIIRAVAVEGQQYLDAAINKDDGSHYLGELAFGTNPALTRHVSNALLVEKIGGSFHVAIGSAYGNMEDAIIDNGNRSVIHWDITTMLRGYNGMIAIDDKVIMQGGLYLDPRLAYLNGNG